VNGLKKLKDELDQARFNNKQSSSQCATIESPLIPYNNQLHLPPIEYISNEQQIDLFHSPTSHFNKYVLHIPIQDLPTDLQLYLPLFSILLFHTSIQYENIQLTKYQFCELTSRDLLSYSATPGQISSSPIQSSYVFSRYSDTYVISLKSLNNLETFKNTIDYIRYVLFGTIFNEYNIIIEECEKRLKNLIETLQDGQTVHQTFFNSLLYANDSNMYYHQMNIFLQKNLFEKICKQPKKYEKEIISKLERIKLFILKNLSQMHLTICGSLEIIKENWQIIEQFMNESKIKSQVEIENIQAKEKHIPVLSPATIIGSPQEESGLVFILNR
jgi:Zn-dependent M16 (insulinase) family peptidase